MATCNAEIFVVNSEDKEFIIHTDTMFILALGKARKIMKQANDYQYLYIKKDGELKLEWLKVISSEWPDGVFCKVIEKDIENKMIKVTREGTRYTSYYNWFKINRIYGETGSKIIYEQQGLF